MITFLYDKNNSLISNLIHSAILNPDIIKIENRLLDGTYHTQSIGERMDVFFITMYVDEAGKAKFDNLYATQEPVKLIKRNKYYIGNIKEKEEWEMFSKDLYTTSFHLVVGQEGFV